MTISERLSAALADRYRIERELGQGGMAIVYLAEDVKHKRRVALKVLRPELAAALGSERFLVEIATTANLRHPHILPLFDSGDADGALFYVMPFVDGESLRSRLDREAQLPLDEATQIISEVADALSYAHGRGVVHRDIKPENILLENGHAVVADFGIAQAVTDSGGERLTQTGMVLGTPLYMSPEQSNGEPVDARSDLYALGCVAYEMLAGGPPFSGATALVVMARHAMDPVPSLRTARPGAPVPVAEAIERALAKVPADRFPTVRAWRDAMEAPPAATGTTGPVTTSRTKRAAEGFWVAVLPFKYAGADPDVTALAEGLSEEMVTGLSRFSYIRVIAQAAAGRDLGAAYLLEGSLRQSGSRLRIAVQLVDTSSGAHLWAETYDRPFSSEAVFDLQDELVPRIVSTVADMHGVLPQLMSEPLRLRDPGELTPFEAVVRSLGYYRSISVEEHAEIRAMLERAVETTPGLADGWAMLSMLYSDEHTADFNPRPDSLGRALAAARRAVAAAPTNQLAYHALAVATFFEKDFKAFRPAAERAVALNPMDGCTIAYMGIMMAYSGDWDHGLALADHAMQLNPHHPGWYRFANFYNAFRKADYRGALDVALKINMPSYFYTHVVLAAAYGMLGEQAAARRALRELAAQKPGFALVARRELGKWFDQDVVEKVVEGLRRAGLAIPDDGEAASPTQTVTAGPEVGVVVLPFVNRSPDSTNEYFSDGLTEEIITDLSRLDALRVISRNSSMTLKGTTASTGELADQLGVTHVVTGSVRRAGDAIRVTAELIDVATDSPLWSEKYSGTMADVFGIQEEIAQKIVAALKIRLTDSEVAEAKAVQRPIQEVGAWDCYLRARQEMYGWTPESLDRAERLVDEAVGIAGDNPLLLATKGQIVWIKVNVMFDPDERLLDQADDFAGRALALDQDHHLGLFVRGIVAGLRGDATGAVRDSHRAHRLRPGDPNVLAEFCRFGYASGVDVTGHVADLVRIDPLTPVTWLVQAFDHFLSGRIEEAVPPARRCLALSPTVSTFHILVAWIFAKAGLAAEAIALLQRAGEALAGTLHGSWALFLRYALDGDAERALPHMTPLLARGTSIIELNARTIADGYSLLGRNDDALEWIRIAMNRGFINYPFLAGYDPLLANVRADPRFPVLMQEVKARWEALGQSLPDPLRLVPALPEAR